MKSGWAIKPVGDVCTIVGGGTPARSNSAFFEGSIPWATIRDMKSDWIEETEFSITRSAVQNSSTNVLPAGTVIVASRVGLGKVCRARRETAINQDLRGFIPKSSEHLDPQYLFLWFKSVAREIVAAGTGATVQGVTLPFLRSLQIPLPPLQEQKRIVAKLDEALAAIATAIANSERNVENARAMFSAFLESSFVVDGPRWITRPLSELIGISHGYAFKGEDFKSGEGVSGPIVLTPGNYTEDAELAFTTRNTKHLISGVAPKDFSFAVGDLTVVMTDLSSKMKILGRPAFIESPNILHNQRIGRILFISNSVEPRLVYYAMQRESALRHVRDTATGTMVRHTAPKRILAHPISYPEDREKQKALVARLDAVRLHTKELRHLQALRLKELADLKDALLRDAFLELPMKPQPLAA